MNLNKYKIAIVCDWLTTAGGAEKVILMLHRLFPQAPVYTTIYNPEKVKGFENATVKTSYLQQLPFAKSKHQFYVPLMPRVFEKMNLNDYDIVISSSHSCAKGVITKPSTLHICYCHSPMRYAWEDNINYIKQYDVNPVVKKLAPWFIHKLRMWDRLSTDRVDAFIANSHHVQARINKYYRRPSTVIYPGIATNTFVSAKTRKPFYLAVGRLTPYKRFDLVIEAFNKNGLPLKIVGTGVSSKKLQALAKPNIEFLDFVDEDKLRELYATAKALIFPQIEDLGLIPLEAMASGCPVIAYGQGGALETVIDGKTGLFFHHHTPDALNKALEKNKNKKWQHAAIKKHADQFSEKQFQQNIIKFIEKKWDKWHKS